MYDAKKAGNYWTKRVSEINELSAVLTYNAPNYVNESYSFWELNSLFNNLPKNLKGLKALDISCGVGRISIPLAKRGATVTGIDISEGMLKTCRKNIAFAGLTSKIMLYKCNAVAISVPDRHFDIVLCLGLLEHLPDPLRKKVLDEMERTVKPHGTAIVLVNNDKSIFLKKEKRYTKKSQNKKGYMSGLMNRERIRNYMERKGFNASYVASNPFYSAVYRLLNKENSNAIDEQELYTLFNYLARLDLRADAVSRETGLFSDQFMIKAVKNK